MSNIKDNIRWEELFFDACKEKISQNLPSLEDQRMADWRLLLSLPSRAEALVIGSGLGTTPISLTTTCQRVYAADTSNERTLFLNRRKEQQGLENLVPLFVSDLEEFHFSPESLDLVSINPGEQKDLIKERSLFQTIRFLKRFLRPGGSLHLTLENRLSLQGFLRKRCGSRGRFCRTLFGYRKILKNLGFSRLKIYAPLPNFDGIPLFYLPLNSPQIIYFFLEKILPLIEMVSPETKQAYSREYRIAKLGLAMATHLRLARLLPYCVSGYCIMAQRN